MGKIKYLTDTASDLPGSFREKYDIDFDMIPISIVVDDAEYKDDQNSNFKEFYKVLRSSKELPKTAQINTYTFLEYYKKYYEEGYTQVIGLFLPSFASGTHQNALLAKEQFKEEYPNAQMEIFVPDTKSYSLGYGLGLIEAAKKEQQGASYDEIKQFIIDWISRIEIYFSMYSLEYARKSGRLGKTAALVGDILGIKPIMCVKDGELSIYKKVRGNKAILRELAKIAEERMDRDGIYAVLKGETEEEGDKLYASIKEICGHEGYEPAYSGPAVTINSGPEIVGMGFVRK